MSFRSVEVLTSSDNPEFCFWEVFYVDNAKSTGKDLDLFQSKKIWLNVLSRKVWSNNYSTKKTYMKKSRFGCSSVTCGTWCSNMFVATSGLHQQDRCYCMLQHLIPIKVWFNIFLSEIHSTSEDLQFMEMDDIRCIVTTRGTRCPNMCSATSDSGLVGHYCCVFGAKMWFRFDLICCYFSVMNV